MLTNRRLIFVEKGGLLGRPRPAEPVRASSLETLGGAAPHPTEMRIGYGDRMILEGVEVDGAVYELGRETPSRPVLELVAAAREARRTELGLEADIAPCRSCGRWVARGIPLCDSCVPRTK